MNSAASLSTTPAAPLRRLIPVFVVLIAALAAVLAFVMLTPRAARFHGMALDAGEPIHDLTFESENGPVTVESFRGRTTVFYFGYTQCPDVCPTSLSDAARALKSLGADADRIRVVMVTIDPQRDDAAHVARYARIFDPRFVGLSGSQAQIADAASRFGVHYARSATSAGAYSMEHTASMLVLDAEGRLRVILPYGMPSTEIADDLKAALQL
jgi:protein SCO1/2